DGNGRWAEAKNLPRTQGHAAGAEAVKRVVKACLAHRIPCLSLFAFSSENWQRPPEEISALMDLFLQALQKEIQELHQNQVKIRFTGYIEQLSHPLRTHIAEAEALTQNNQQLTLNIVVNYGGKWDIVQASKRLAQDVLNQSIHIDAIDESLFANALSTRGLPDPDMLIRTSGEQRISNFFLWQLAYAELYFTPIYWPDFDESSLAEALSEFQKRKRRFGKTHA
ncbi:MAG: polyprenyl diphosphate synthase, partial [Methylococcales bacterium]|nr:polyprenyl diphosphate synthase [Methylococcales bacterium]